MRSSVDCITEEKKERNEMIGRQACALFFTSWRRTRRNTVLDSGVCRSFGRSSSKSWHFVSHDNRIDRALFIFGATFSAVRLDC